MGTETTGRPVRALTAFAVSMALPPPSATSPSTSCAAATASSTTSTGTWAWTPENRFATGSSSPSQRRVVISSGLRMPIAARSSS